MKRMILMILLVAATVQISSAQQPNSPNREKKGKHTRNAETRERKGDLRQFFAKELGLTDEQAEAFAPIYAEYRKALRGEKPENKQAPDMKEANDAQVVEHLNAWLDKDIHVATVRKAYIDKFLTVLTPKQVAKLYKIESSAGKGGHNGPQHGRPGAKGGHPGGHGTQGDRGSHHGAGAPR